MSTKRRVGIFIYNGAEVLDFAGPFEVFSVAAEQNHQLYEVFTISKETVAIITANGLSVNPTYDFNNCPEIDILIIAGGSGSRALMEDSYTLNWIYKTYHKSEFTLSICSGARLLGKLGLLDGEPYCTHAEVYEEMSAIVPSGNPQQKKRYVKTGKLYTSGGISAGIDLSFHLLEKLSGLEIATQTAAYMEYIRTPYLIE